MKFSKILLSISVFLIPFYFFRFHVGPIPTNIFEVFVFLSLIFYLIYFCCHPRHICHPRESGDPENYSYRFRISPLRSPFAKATEAARQGYEGQASLQSGMTKKKNWVFLLIFFLILAISIIISPDLISALGIAKGWFIVPAIFGGLIYKNFDSKNIAKSAIPLFISVQIVAVWALLQKVGIIHTLFYQVGDISFDQYIAQGRIFGPFESPNYLAMFLASASFFCLMILDLGRNKIGRMVLALTFVLPLLAIYFSGSRAGIIAIVISMAIYLNYRFINKRSATKEKPFHKIIFAIGWVVVNFIYLIYVTSLAENPIGGDSIRVEIYRHSITMLENIKSFIFGIGLGNFQENLVTLPLSNSFIKFGLGYALYPHNLFLALWLNLGLLGLIGFIYLIILFFKYCYESKNFLRAALIAAMFAILIQGFFDTTYFKNDLAAIFWLLFAGGLILHREEKDEKSNV